MGVHTALVVGMSLLPVIEEALQHHSQACGWRGWNVSDSMPACSRHNSF